MDTEISTREICRDKVDLFDGVDSTQGRLSNSTFCGRTLPPSFISSSTDLMIKFTSNIGTSHSGFAFTYIAHPPTSKFNNFLKFHKQSLIFRLIYDKYNEPPIVKIVKVLLRNFILNLGGFADMARIDLIIDPRLQITSKVTHFLPLNLQNVEVI